MNILHYVMGIPPIREGGAIKYALDLAEKQADYNQKVFLLYPGAIRGRKKVCIRKRNVKNGIKYFEIINPLPVPGAFGMCNEKYFTEKADKEVYYKFLKENKIEMIHFHSLQGLHIELLDAADELHINKVFTSHDYFGICPKTILLYRERICHDIDWSKCAECCDHPDSYATLVRRQSHWFRGIVKCTFLFTLLEVVWKKIGKKTDIIPKEKKNDTGIRQTDYKELKNYYMEIFRRIDLMHYNSTVAQKVYEEFRGHHVFLLEGIMHSDIIDKRKRRYCGDIIRFGYLGNGEVYKGFPILREVLDKIYAEKKYNFFLNIYFQNDMDREYIVPHKRYQYSDIDDVFNDMDVLIVPSLCAETYGFVVLEAIMHGIPVVVTANVGAKDFLRNYKEIGIIVEPDKDNLESAILTLLSNKEKINKMNKNICNSSIDLNFGVHTQKILAVYRNLQKTNVKA
ncbi:MAG: glycosyltransferase [Blautia sp.]|nr:glycosyltransferase [Blautia sp.]MCM1200950.1 glycosyltransferase [Bacteroides fragilis]